jgi:DNA-binding LacI/PurR family transcriptional regulator
MPPISKKRSKGRGTGQATLREVAKAADVSPMTVSNVINGRFGSMGLDTKQRVEAAIKSLNYRPHSMARGLRLSKKLAIGMLLVDESPRYLADPFTTELVAGLSRRLSEEGYALMLEGIPACQFLNSQIMRTNRLDGLCLALSGRKDVRRRMAERVAQLGIPVVAFQEHTAIPSQSVAVVCQDDRLGGRLLAELLLEKGARRLVFLVAAAEWPAFEERAEGVREACRQSGRRAELCLVRCGAGDFKDIKEALASHVEARGLPDAVMGGNDQMAIAAMTYLRISGFQIPKHVRVTGFNAFEVHKYTIPALTTVRSDAYCMGIEGANLLLDRFRMGVFRQPRLLLPVSLVPGGTT